MTKHTVYGLPGVYNATPLALTDGDGVALAVDETGALILSDTITLPISISGTVTTKEVRSSTPTQSTVAASASNVTLLASNSNRLGGTIANDSTASLYIKLGATASTSSYTVKLLQDDYFEIPFAYTGIIDGIWSSATGNARITELTA